MARPHKNIDWNMVEQKILAGCTAQQIFSSKYTRCAPNTFYNNFKLEFGCSFEDYCEEVSKLGEGDLLLLQHAKAMKGSVPMLQHLGKVRLGQKEAKDDTTIAPHQAQVDQSHTIMQQQNEIEELKKKLEAMSANKPETE